MSCSKPRQNVFSSEIKTFPSKLKIDELKYSFSSHRMDTSTKSKSTNENLAHPEIPANGPVFRSDKAEYDLKPEEIEQVETLTNSKIICNIGYGGFSTVKLIFSHPQKMYYAMKVVSFEYIINQLFYI